MMVGPDAEHLGTLFLYLLVISDLSAEQINSTENEEQQNDPKNEGWGEDRCSP